MRRMLKILIVMTDDAHRETPLYLLESRFQDLAKFRRAGDLETAFDYIDRGDVACIVLDLQLTDADGRDPLATLHEKHPTIPIVILTEAGAAARAANAVKAGSASAYLVKGATTEDGIVEHIVRVLKVGERPLDLSAGRASPDASTKRPKLSPAIPIDVVDSGPPSTARGIPSAVPPIPPADELPAIEVPLDKVNRRLERLEAETALLSRNHLALTWLVGGFIVIVVIWALLS